MNVVESAAPLQDTGNTLQVMPLKGRILHDGFIHLQDKISDHSDGGAVCHPHYFLNLGKEASDPL